MPYKIQAQKYISTINFFGNTFCKYVIQRLFSSSKLSKSVKVWMGDDKTNVGMPKK